MKKFLQIIFVLILTVGYTLLGMGKDSFSIPPKEKKDSVVIKCKPTVEKCVLVVANDLEILMEPSDSIIADIGLSPAQLISVTVERDLQKNRPKLWDAIPVKYREKLAGVLIIKHTGVIDLDDI